MGSIPARKVLSTITAVCFIALFSFLGYKLLTGSKAAISTQWVHVSGNQILNGNGQQIYFSGLDDASFDQGQGLGKSGSTILGTGNGYPIDNYCNRYWTPISDQEIDELLGPTSKGDAGLNTIRLALNWADLEPLAPTQNSDGTLTHHWNTTYVSYITDAIEYIHNTYPGAMVILDMHQATWSPAFSGPNMCDGGGMPIWLYPDNRPGTTTNPTANNLPGAISISTAKSDFFNDINPYPSSVPENPIEGFEAAWQYLASQYASGQSYDSTVAAADMFNEPIDVPSSGTHDLASFYQTIGNAIRSVNPNIILIYEDNAYTSYVASCGSSAGCSFILTSKPTFNPAPDGSQNAIYSWHYYPTAWDSANQGYLNAHISRAGSWDVPLWIGENDAFGIMNSTSAETTTQTTDLTDMLSYFKNNGIDNDVSWTLWAYNAGSYHFNLPSDSTTPKPLINILEKYESVPSTVTTPPNVTITSPAVQATLSGNAIVSASASVATGSISSITLTAVSSTGTINLTTCTNADTCSYTWNTSNVANGQYEINASTTASNGDSANATAVHVSVNNSVACTPPIVSTPSNLTSPSQTATSVKLSWNASTDCNGLAVTYHIYRAESGSWVQVGTSSSTSYSDSGLNAGTTYDYEIDATDTSGNTSAMSSSLSQSTQKICVTTPTTPSGLNATSITSSSATLNWSAVSNPSSSCVIDHYQVDVINPSGNVIATSQVKAPTTSYTAASLTPLTSYSFSVVAVTNDKTPSGVASASFKTLKAACIDSGPTVPGNLSATASSTTQVNLIWNTSSDSCSGISGYNIFREQQGSSSFQQVNTGGPVSSLSYADADLSSHTTYNYYVVALSGSTPPKTAQSGTITVTTLDPGPGLPSISATAVSSSEIDLNFSGSDPGYSASALQYNIYLGSNPNNPPSGTPTYTQKGATPPPWLDKGLAANTLYFYGITATNPLGQTSATNYADTSTLRVCANLSAPTTPSGLNATSITSSSATLNWSAVGNPSSSCVIDHYQVDVIDPSGNVIATSQVKAPTTSYTAASLTPLTSYSFSVVAVTNDKTPSGVASASFKTLKAACIDSGPTVPTGLTPFASDNDQITLSWNTSSDSCSGISGYNIFREQQGSSSFQQVNKVLVPQPSLGSSASYADADLKSDTTYSYYVVAISGDNKTSQSIIKTITTPTIPITIPGGGNGSGGGVINSGGGNDTGGLSFSPLLYGTTSVGSGSEASGSNDSTASSNSNGNITESSNTITTGSSYGSTNGNVGKVGNVEPAKVNQVTKKINSNPVAAYLYSLIGIAFFAACIILITFKRRQHYSPATTTPNNPDILPPQPQVIHPDNNPNGYQVNDPTQNYENKENIL